MKLINQYKGTSIQIVANDDDSIRYGIIGKRSDLVKSGFVSYEGGCSKSSIEMWDFVCDTNLLICGKYHLIHNTGLTQTEALEKIKAVDERLGRVHGAWSKKASTQ